jgi:hypothetical protein
VTILRAARAAAAATVLLLIAACARSDGFAEATEPVEPYPADGLVVRVEHTGGMVTPAMLVTRLPLVSVYADGRVISPGPQLLSYPPPALPNLQEQRIDAAGVRTLVDLARAAGIGGPAIDYGQPPIADAVATRFTVRTNEGSQIVEVYALGDAATAQDGLTAEQVRARAALTGFLSALTDLPATLDDQAVRATQAYVPTAIAAVATPWAGDPQMPSPPAIAWPGPALPGDTAGPNTPCVTVTGDAVARTLAAARPAKSTTPWTSAGERWRVDFRPLLPDEANCADLTRD